MIGLTYSNVYAADHIFWSEARACMAPMMESAMVTVILAYMMNMYSNTKANLIVFSASAVVLARSLYLVRSNGRCRMSPT